MTQSLIPTRPAVRPIGNGNGNWQCGTRFHRVKWPERGADRWPAFGVEANNSRNHTSIPNACLLGTSLPLTLRNTNYAANIIVFFQRKLYAPAYA